MEEGVHQTQLTEKAEEGEVLEILSISHIYEHPLQP